MGDGVFFLGKYRTKLVVKGICFIAIIFYWMVVHLQCGNANVFSFICVNKLPESFWISFQAVSNVVVNIVFVRFCFSSLLSEFLKFFPVAF